MRDLSGVRSPPLREDPRDWIAPQEPPPSEEGRTTPFCGLVVVVEEQMLSEGASSGSVGGQCLVRGRDCHYHPTHPLTSHLHVPSIGSHGVTVQIQSKFREDCPNIVLEGG